MAEDTSGQGTPPAGDGSTTAKDANRTSEGTPPEKDTQQSEQQSEQPSKSGRAPAQPRRPTASRQPRASDDDEDDDDELSERESAQQQAREQEAQRAAYSRALGGRGLSDLERERLDQLGPQALGVAPPKRDRETPQTVNGPLDYPMQSMSDKDAWKRAEAEAIQRSRDEVERAAKAVELQKPGGIDTLWTVRSSLAGQDKERVAFSEVNPLHPHGYAYVAGSESAPVIIAPTPEAQRALFERRIMRVDAPVPKFSARLGERSAR